MKKIFITASVILLIAVLFLLPKNIYLTEVDVTGDGATEYLQLQKRFNGTYFIIKSERGEELYCVDMSYLSPKSIQICNLDGDDEREIFIVVHKSTMLHEEVIDRPFFFNFRNGELYSKWTGSKFGRPFSSVYFFDIFSNGIDEVLAVSEVDDKVNLAVSRWNGFGFDFLGESRVVDEISNIYMIGDRAYADIKEDKKEFTAHIVFENGEFVFEEE